MYRYITWTAMLFVYLILACEEKDPEEENLDEDNQNSNMQDQAGLVDSDFTIAGTLNLPDSYGDASEELLQNNPVELQDIAGTTLASGYSDEQGNYSIEAASTLLLDPSATLVKGEESNYQIVSIIEEDGDGKVLGVKQPLSLSKSAVKNGVVKAGASLFAEVAAIKGVVSFVHPDGTVNDYIAKIGTDVYLPGFSFIAKTDHLGQFLILYVPAAEYVLRIERGSISYEQDIKVDESTTLNLGTIEIQTDTEAPKTISGVDSTDYKNPFCVHLSTDEKGAAIYFTTDGSNPQVDAAFKYPPSSLVSCGASTDCPICIQNRSTMLKYFAVDTAGNAESIHSNFYFYNEKWSDPQDKQAPTTTLDITKGTCKSDNQVTGGFTCTSGVTFSLNTQSMAEGAMYYALTGLGESAPSSSSFQEYTFPVELSSSKVVYYYTQDWAGNIETVNSTSIKIYSWSIFPIEGEGTGVGMGNNAAVTLNKTRNELVLYVNDFTIENHDVTFTLDLAGNPASLDQWIETYVDGINSDGTPGSDNDHLRLFDAPNTANAIRHSRSIFLFDASTATSPKRLVLLALQENYDHSNSDEEIYIKPKLYYQKDGDWTTFSESANGDEQAPKLNCQTTEVNGDGKCLDAYFSAGPMEVNGELRLLALLYDEVNGGNEDNVNYGYEVTFDWSNFKTIWTRIDENGGGEDDPDNLISTELDQLHLYPSRNHFGYTSMTFDSSSDLMVLFGFERNGISEVKTYNYGVNSDQRWKSTSYKSYQTPHVFGCMTYDERRDTTIYFGGSSYYNHNPADPNCGEWTVNCTGADSYSSWSSAEDKTWELDSEKGWVEIQPVWSPPAMSRCNLFYNPNDGKSYLYGGFSKTGYKFDRLWVYGP